MGKHTKGPWEFFNSPEYGYSALLGNDGTEQVLAPSGINDGDAPITWMGEDMSDEDKLLIEAAPALLEGIRQIRGWRELRSHQEVPIERIEAICDQLIATATGLKDV